jgi:nicotinamidase-related amidase
LKPTARFQSILFLLFFSFTALPASADSINSCSREASPREWSNQDTVYANPGKLFEGTALAFVTHAAKKWDTGGCTEPNLDTHVKRFLDYRIPVLYLVDVHSGDSPNDLSTYYPAHRPNFLVYSIGGAHEIHTHVTNLYFMGGFFEMCAGETVRDAIYYAENKPYEEIRINLLTNAVYSFLSGSVGTLEDVLKNLSDDDMYGFLVNHYFIGNEIGGGQHSANRTVTTSMATFNILRDNRKIGTVGSGPKLVSVNFMFPHPTPTPPPETTSIFQ